jgi:hypothetical protein
VGLYPTPPSWCGAQLKKAEGQLYLYLSYINVSFVGRALQDVVGLGGVHYSSKIESSRACSGAHLSLLEAEYFNSSRQTYKRYNFIP